jgi:hypothetical protein
MRPTTSFQSFLRDGASTKKPLPRNALDPHTPEMAGEREQQIHGPRPGRVFYAVERQQPVEAEIHDGVATDDLVLEIDSFNLWYGKSRALYDISMAVPRGKVTALIDGRHSLKAILLIYGRPWT